MGKFIKVFVSLLVLLLIVLTIFSYVGFGGKEEGGKVVADCKKFTTKVDSKSKANIAEIVNTLADTSTFGLAFKSNHLKKIGAEVDKSVPSPLSFLYVIFSDPHLAKQMKVVRESSMKYDNFVEGLFRNMYKLYKDPKCFEEQITEFAKALNLDVKKTITVAETCGKHGDEGNKKAFKPFVDYLIQQKAK